jgi:hypothetical protein
LPVLAEVVHRKLEENYRCLYLNSGPMVAGMRSYLAAAGVDVEHETTKGSLIVTSEQTHVKDGVFDADGMIGTLEQGVQQALADGYAGLFATGDMSWEVGPDRDLEKLMRYERNLERLFHKYPGLSGICQYHADSLPREFMRQGLNLHGSIFLNQTLSMVNPDYVPEGSSGTWGNGESVTRIIAETSG